MRGWGEGLGKGETGTPMSGGVPTPQSHPGAPASSLLPPPQWDGSPGLALAPLSSAPQCLVQSSPFNRDLCLAGKWCISYALENNPLNEAKRVLPMVIGREFFILKFQHNKKSASLMVEMQTLGLVRGSLAALGTAGSGAPGPTLEGRPVTWPVFSPRGSHRWSQCLFHLCYP